MSDRLPDKMEQNARVEVRKDGTVIGTRRIINFLSSGSDADDSVNDIVSVVMTGGTSDTLWEYVSVFGTMELHPNVPGDPDQFVVNVTGVSDAIFVNATDTVFQGSDFSSIDINGSTGDINIGLNEDFNVSAGRDINLQAGRDIVGADSGLAGDVNISASTGTGASSGDVNISADRDSSLFATNDNFIQADRDVRIDYAGIDQVAIRAPSSAPTTARMNNGSLSFYLDEAGNNLKVTVKYSGGTVKTATIPVV